jgi:AcrR family transcriptional regulator
MLTRDKYSWSKFQISSAAAAIRDQEISCCTTAIVPYVVSRDSVKRTDTKAAILRIALELFTQHGYEGTSIRQITTCLGITPAALYYHFESKEAVLLGIAEPMLTHSDDLLRLVEPLTLDRRTARIALEGYYDVLATQVELFRFISNDPLTRTHPVVGKRFRQLAKVFYGFLDGPDNTIESQIRTAGAVGTIRRSLELRTVDPVKHRDTIIDVAVAILKL